MKSLRIPLLLAVLAHAVPAGAAHLPVSLLEHVDDRVLALSIPEEALVDSPRWQPGQGPVPFTVQQLIRRIENWVQQTRPEVESVRFREFVLKPVESPRYGRYWHYLVVFRPVVGGRESEQDSYVAVLLDGRIFHGLVEPGL